MTREVDVLVIGAGPAGLAAAAFLAATGAGRVEVLDREQQAGGVPRHCAHGGFGTWLHPLTGPAYARLLTDSALRAGAVVHTGVTVLDWADPRGMGREFDHGSAAPTRGAGNCATSYDGAALNQPPDPALSSQRPALGTVGPAGPETIDARAVILATGARERPRAARLIPGTRPTGIYTTGELQQAVHLHGQRIGTRAVIVGAESVSYSAADTVRAGGADVVAMVTEADRAHTTRARAREARLLRRIPLLTQTTVAELLGHGRLSGVRVRHRDGRTTELACDTVVFTGDFVPENELARRGGLTLAPETSRPGVFAAGGLLHPGQSAAEAARAGTQVALTVREWLTRT